MDEQQRKVLEGVTKKLTDEGRLVEAGWQSMCMYVIPLDASSQQKAEMRNAFFMGAQHLFASIMTVMNEGEEADEEDLKRMSLIHDELESFRMSVTSEHHSGTVQ